MKTTSNAAEVSAPDLAKLAIEAHGGLERWKRFTTLSVHGINGGLLWVPRAKPELQRMESIKARQSTEALLWSPCVCATVDEKVIAFDTRPRVH